MKRFYPILSLVLLLFSLFGCVNYNTPKSEELSAQYDFYSDSQYALANKMDITPEQADEVFLVLVSCGLDGKVGSIFPIDDVEGGFSVYAGFTPFDVYCTGGVVDRVEKGGKELYPNPEPEEPVEPEAPAVPETPATLEEAIDSAISGANAEKEDVQLFNTYSEENPDERRVAIYLAGGDNLTTKLIRKGMLMKSSNILKPLQGRDDISEIILYWSFPMIDASGNSFTDTVMKIRVSKATLDGINFDRFDWNNLPEISDEYFQHNLLNE